MDFKASLKISSETTEFLESNDLVNPAEMLVSAGEHKLLQGHFSEALESFQEAEALIGDMHANLYYREGLALFEYGSEQGDESSLLLASKKFKRAHHLDPYAFDVLHAWGNTLALLGEQQEQHHFFLPCRSR